MVPLYDTVRHRIDENEKIYIERATREAQQRIDSIAAVARLKRDNVRTVTERFIKLGYHDFQYCAVPPGFRSTTNYLRKLARELKRPYITLTRGALDMPDTLKLAPLRAHLDLIATPTTSRITYYRPEHGNGVGLYTNSSGRRRYYFGQNMLFLHDEWVKRAATDPEWRALIAPPIPHDISPAE